MQNIHNNMSKEKQQLVNKIIVLLEKCSSLSTLDLILKLLQKSI